MKVFCKKLCCCLCLRRKVEIENPLIKEEEDNTKDMLHYKDFTNEDEVMFESKNIRVDEIGKLTFSKRSLRKIVDQEFAVSEGYEDVHNKDNMVITLKLTGSIFSNQFPIVRMAYFISRNEFPPGFTLDQLAFNISDSVTRMQWDESLKRYQYVEGHSALGLLYVYMKKPSPFMSERDAIEKVVWFKEGNALYSFSSSVNDDAVPFEPKVERITDYFSAYLLTSDEENFYINSLSQMDFKMNVPNFLLKMTLPQKLKEWYKALKTFINQSSQYKQRDLVLHPNQNPNTTEESKTSQNADTDDQIKSRS